jgi:hypothetical protein
MRKITLFAGGAMAAALVLSGCGSGSNSPSQPGGNAGANPGAASVGSLTQLADLITKQSTQKQAAHVKISVDTQGQAISGEGDMRFGDKPAMDLKLAVPEMTEVTLRFVDDAFYFKLSEEITPGKPWVKIDTNGTDPLSQTLGAAVKEFKENGDPSQMVKQLQAAGEITGTKKEQLNGKDTTHYTVTVDVNKMIANQQDPQLKQLMEAAAKAGITTYPLDVWLDSDGLPARLSANTPVTDPTSQKTQEVKFQADYTDWGKQVNVTAPPADQIAELPR